MISPCGCEVTTWTEARIAFAWRACAAHLRAAWWLTALGVVRPA